MIDTSCRKDIVKRDWRGQDSADMLVCMDRIKDTGNCSKAFLRLMHKDAADLDDLAGGFARMSGRD